MFLKTINRSYLFSTRKNAFSWMPLTENFSKGN